MSEGVGSSVGSGVGVGVGSAIQNYGFMITGIHLGIGIFFFGLHSISHR